MTKQSDFRQILYVWSWQRLRISLDFTTQRSTIDSIQMLRNYLNTDKDQYAAKVWRCLNLASATHMGIRGRIKLQGKTQDLERARYLIEEFRKELSGIYEGLDTTFVIPTEDQQLEELCQAYHNEREAFWRVLADLTKRLRRSKTTGERPELRKYVEKMVWVYTTKGEGDERKVGNRSGSEST